LVSPVTFNITELNVNYTIDLALASPVTFNITELNVNYTIDLALALGRCTCRIFHFFPIKAMLLRHILALSCAFVVVYPHFSSI
jgi:hypothetical protein